MRTHDASLWLAWLTSSPVIGRGSASTESKRLSIGDGGGVEAGLSSGLGSDTLVRAPPFPTVFCFFLSSSRAAFSASSRSRWISARLALSATWPATNSRTCLGSSRSSSSGVPVPQNDVASAAFSLSFIRLGMTETVRCCSSAFDTIIITVRSASIGISWAKKLPAIAVSGVLIVLVLCVLGWGAAVTDRSLSPRHFQNGTLSSATPWLNSSGGADRCSFLVFGWPGTDRFSSPLLFPRPRNRTLDATTSTEVRSFLSLSSYSRTWRRPSTYTPSPLAKCSAQACPIPLNATTRNQG